MPTPLRTLVSVAAAVSLFTAAPLAQAAPTPTPGTTTSGSPDPATSSGPVAPSPVRASADAGVTATPSAAAPSDTPPSTAAAPATPSAVATASRPTGTPAPSDTPAAVVTPSTSNAPSPSAPATRAPIATPVVITSSPTCSGPCAPGGTLFAGFGSLSVTGRSTLPAGTRLVVVMTVDGVGRRMPDATVGGTGTFVATAPLHRSGVVRLVVRTLDGRHASATSSRTVRAPAVVMSAAGVSASTMKGTLVSGRLTTAMARQPVRLSVWRWVAAQRTWRWSYHRTAYTDATGTFRTTLSYNNGLVGTQRWKAAAPYGNAPTVSFSTTFTERKLALLEPVVEPVTAAMVPRTYRPGCPVGPSQLRRLSMNHFGFDGRLHRGHVVVRSTHVTKVQNVFTAAFTAHFPFRVMTDPSAYGNDDTSMAADNTYAFFCRQVNGNPYATSPHTYGRSIDVNPVENPYRKPNGIWYPANGHPYVNRSIRRPGMLFSDSAMTRAFRANGFTWYTGFDWQHFQA